MENPRKAYRNFEMNYFGKMVGWNGYIIRVNLNDDDPMSMAYHSAQLMVKMEPSDMPDGHGADIGVTMSEMNLDRYSEEID